MSNIERVAQIIDSKHIESIREMKFPNPNALAYELMDAGLIAPDGLAKEWTATVRFTNEAGQWETHTGMGGTEQEALDDARDKQHFLYQPREDAYRTAWRWISKWHMNDQVTHLDIVEGQPDED